MDLKNPLTKAAGIAGIIAAYDVFKAFSDGSLNVFSAYSILISVILLLMVIRQSRSAGTFLFYSVLPIYPIYFGLIALGYLAAPPYTGVYFILGFIYLTGTFGVWKLKVRYADYLAKIDSATDHCTPELEGNEQKSP